MSIFSIIIFNIVFTFSISLLLWSLPVRQFWARSMVIIVFIFITIMYTWWRACSLPYLDFAFGSLWPWLFFLSELITILYEIWTSMVMIRFSNHSQEADAYESLLRNCKHLPTVDIFIPTYNESESVLEGPIIAAKSLDYPDELIRIFINDDGGRETIQKLAKKHSVEYLARPTVKDEKGNEIKVGGPGKAGNDRFAFTKSQGEYILMLDADFQVQPNFLYRTLGFLMFRPNTGLVQTPQHFHNSDVIGHNLLAPDCVPEDQHFFMTITQPCRDSWGNAFCTGTGCIVPRKLLKQVDPIWGFPNQTICEDIELTYALIGIGQRTLYLNEPLAFGLAPESIVGFLKQRVRWCSGTIQNLFAQTGPFKGNLKLIDRLFYCEGVFYWQGSLFMAMLALAPLIFWLSGVPAVTGTPENALEVLLPRLISQTLIIYWLSEGKIPPAIVTVSKVLPAFHLSAAFIKTFIFPKSATFKVTDKNPDRNHTTIYWPLFLFFSALSGMTTLGLLLAVTGTSYLVAPISDLINLNILWSIYSIAVCMFCACACVELPYIKKNDNEEITVSKPLGISAALSKRWLGIKMPTMNVTQQIKYLYKWLFPNDGEV